MSLLLQEEVGVKRAETIRRRDDVGPIPLSFAQQRLWFLDQLEPGSPQYNTPMGARLTGKLNVPALEKTIREIVQRHEALRTIFPVVDGQPMQIVLPHLDVEVPVHDLTGLPPELREERAREIANEEGARLFDLATGPMIRACLVRLAEDEHWLLLMTHHTVFDSWSVGVFSKELALLYGAFVDNAPSPLPELEIQYGDYAVWQRGWLQGETLERELDHWVNRLKGAPPLLLLPTDRPRPPVQTFRGRIESFSLPGDLTRALKDLSREQGVTPYMTFLAAFQTLLSRYSGQDDIVVSGGLATRSRRETEDLIGCFINILLFRTDLSGEPTFLELLRRVHDVTLDVYAHQELPFEKLVAALHPKRDLSYNPLTQVMFVLHNSPRPVSEFHGLKLSSIGTSERMAAQYDMLLHIYDRPANATGPDQGVRGVLEYNTDLFETATIKRFLGHFRTLLEEIVADPRQRVTEINLLTQEQRRQVLDEWNSTRNDFPKTACVHELFEEQAARTPDKVAAQFEDESVSYAELNRRANRLARFLVTNGVGPETLVAILAERNIEYLVSLLAVHKAGGAFLPLDPRNPASRIAQVLRHSETPLVLCDEAFLGVVERAVVELPPEGAPCVVRIKQALTQTGDEDNLPRRSSLDNLAYVMFTSGSTGAPKGAMIEHAGMLNHMRSKLSDLHMTAADTLAQNSPQSFDIMVWQFLAPLTIGARVRIFGNDIAYNPGALLDHVHKEKVTVLQLVPTLLKGMVQEAEARGTGRPDLTALRWIVPTGEALPTELCRRWFRLYPSIPILNNCGATECSDDYCHYPAQDVAQLDDALPIMPIGRPIQNMSTYVLDTKLQPVPIGVIGELHASGVALGRGYFKDPALTAQTFIPNPLSRTPGARLYKSRDQARHLPDGVIEIRGRIDEMVKVRGFRVEIGEIEAVLARHAKVRDTVVVARDEGEGNKRLVAYVVPVAGQLPTTSELANFIREQLPDYMVPSAFVLLDALPLSPNGKTDRNALPAPDAARPALDQSFAEPENELEETIRRIWTETLGIERIGVNDNFFDLGGDSFSIINIIQKLPRPVALAEFIKSPTIRSLAERLASETKDETSILQLLTRHPAPAAPALVCVPYGGGNVVVYQPLAQALAEGFAVYSVALPGHDIGRADEQLLSVDEIAGMCVEAIEAIERPVYLYGHCAGVAVTMEVARRLEEMNRDLRGVFVGGAFPTFVGKLRKTILRFSPIRRFDTDEKIFDFLRELGGIDGTIGSQEVDFVTKGFRHDGQCANDYFSRASSLWAARRLKAPLVCVVGDCDPITKNFEKRYRLWERFSDAVELKVIKNGGHYFVKQQAAELAELFKARIYAASDTSL